jgi:CPA1 family monovalent cation:H+ antiporter
MGFFELVSILITVAALFSWVNERWIRLPATIGLMVIALAFSLLVVALGALGLGTGDEVRRLLGEVDFDETLLQGMLGALLFAGALHVDLNDLGEQKGTVSLLASLGVLTSTLIVGVLSWWLFGWLGLGVSFAACLVFGALISPTDPIAVLGILKQIEVPKSLEVKIAGESLFNDGVALVLFLVLVGVWQGEVEVGLGAVTLLFVQEAFGGVLFGLGVGWLAFAMLRTVDSYSVEILITLSIVTGGYALANALHVSGPLAMVVAGLLIGNQGRRFAMSTRTRARLDAFWELVDEFLNALLFLLIGLEILLLPFSARSLAAGALAIPLVIGARWLSVGGPVTLLRRWRPFSPAAVRILTWGGLRGGISVALALSLPPGPERGVIVVTTYVIVGFSIIVQGLTMRPLLARLYASPSRSRIDVPSQPASRLDQ